MGAQLRSVGPLVGGTTVVLVAMLAACAPAGEAGAPSTSGDAVVSSSAALEPTATESSATPSPTESVVALDDPLRPSRSMTCQAWKELDDEDASFGAITQYLSADFVASLGEDEWFGFFDNVYYLCQIYEEDFFDAPLLAGPVFQTALSSGAEWADLRFAVPAPLGDAVFDGATFPGDLGEKRVVSMEEWLDFKALYAGMGWDQGCDRSTIFEPVGESAGERQVIAMYTESADPAAVQGCSFADANIGFINAANPSLGWLAAGSLIDGVSCVAAEAPYAEGCGLITPDAVYTAIDDTEGDDTAALAAAINATVALN